MLTKKMALAAKRTLVRARKLIEKPEKWGKGELFFDKRGLGLLFYTGGAPKTSQIGSMCALGAIKIADGSGEDAARELLADAIHSFKHKGSRRNRDDLSNQKKVFTFNDRKKTTHAEILAAFDKAIELAEAEANQ